MITLQPISKNIQSTLYEKIEMMKKHEGRQLANPDNPEPPNRPYIIGEPMIKNGNRNLNYMMARTPWLRMTSFTPGNGLYGISFPRPIYLDPLSCSQS